MKLTLKPLVFAKKLVDYPNKSIALCKVIAKLAFYYTYEYI